MSVSKILIAGEGGQGVQTIAKILADTGVGSGYNVSYIPSFGVEQRGTPSVAFLILGKEPIGYPRFGVADFVVVLQKRAIGAVVKYISPNTKVIFDSSTISAQDLPKKSGLLFGTPATRYASEKFTSRAFNILLTGKLAKLLNLNKEKTWQSVEKNLLYKIKDPIVRQANEEAFLFGYDLVFEVENFSIPSFCPSTKKIISKGFNKKAEILPAMCKGCGICIEKCPVKALKFSQTLRVFATPIPEVDLEKCIACGNCTRFCPDGAIVVEKDQSSK